MPAFARAALSAAVLLLCVPAAAEPFSGGTFQIFGGMDGGSGDVSAAQRAPGAMAEHLRSREISFSSSLAEGSILVRTGARRLYLILAGGKAIEYHVGVGREGFTWSGTGTITRKAEWPDWRPPPDMIARERRKGRELPPLVRGGPDNPLGARALHRRHGVSHSRHDGTLEHRTGRLIRLHPHDQRRRHRPL